jgi:hypothetical protein
MLLLERWKDGVSKSAADTTLMLVLLLQERDAEKARVDAERLASERAFYSELQVQEADAKSGGQRGMNPHKKRRKP